MIFPSLPTLQRVHPSRIHRCRPDAKALPELDLPPVPRALCNEPRASEVARLSCSPLKRLRPRGHTGDPVAPSLAADSIQIAQ